MFSTTINDFLNNVKHFLGTFACDTLPTRFEKPAALIVNTDPSTKPGEHWVAIYIDENSNGEYFDSFGLPPMGRIETFLAKHTNGYRFNTVTLQTPAKFSQTCGNYCILFVSLRCRGFTLEEMMPIFTRNTFLNDMIIKKLLPLCACASFALKELLHMGESHFELKHGSKQMDRSL